MDLTAIRNLKLVTIFLVTLVILSSCTAPMLTINQTGPFKLTNEATFQENEILAINKAAPHQIAAILNFEDDYKLILLDDSMKVTFEYPFKLDKDKFEKIILLHSVPGEIKILTQVQTNNTMKIMMRRFDAVAKKQKDYNEIYSFDKVDKTSFLRTLVSLFSNISKDDEVHTAIPRYSPDSSKIMLFYFATLKGDNDSTGILSVVFDNKLSNGKTYYFLDEKDKERKDIAFEVNNNGIPFFVYSKNEKKENKIFIESIYAGLNQKMSVTLPKELSKVEVDVKENGIIKFDRNDNPTVYYGVSETRTDDMMGVGILSVDFPNMKVITAKQVEFTDKMLKDLGLKDLTTYSIMNAFQVDNNETVLIFEPYTIEKILKTNSQGSSFFIETHLTSSLIVTTIDKDYKINWYDKIEKNISDNWVPETYRFPFNSRGWYDVLSYSDIFKNKLRIFYLNTIDEKGLFYRDINLSTKKISPEVKIFNMAGNASIGLHESVVSGNNLLLTGFFVKRSLRSIGVDSETLDSKVYNIKIDTKD